MNEIVDRKYVALLAPRLDRFKSTGSQWNFRCPICGDSQKNKAKARGYLFSKGGKVIYYCHNCHASMPLGIFLKKHFPDMYRNYVVDVFGGGDKPKTTKAKSIGMKDRFKKSKLEVATIESLPSTHPAKLYIQNRMIPSHHFNDIYFTPDFKALVDKFIPENDKKLPYNESRIILPIKSEDGEIVGFQGRALDSENKIRYITIKKNDDVPKIFGLDNIDWKKPVYVVEGPFDSLFIDNCLATMDSKLDNIVKYKKDGEYIFINDNEPRNKVICKEYNREIENGFPVVIWEEGLVQKDINDMVIDGIDVMAMISSRIFKGLQAKLEYAKWKKI